jgi:alpha-galactosidase
VINDGLIDNLPCDMVVEVPAVVDQKGVNGVKLGMLPRGIAGLMRNQVATVDLTAEAVIQASRELALQALLLDPIVDSVRRADALLDAMLGLQKDYLGYLK